MKINAKSMLAANTALAYFAPNHGKQGYRVEENGDVTVMVVDECDHCGKACEGANSVTFIKPRKWFMDLLAVRKIAKVEVYDESGCTEDGDVVCSECYAKQAKVG
jgi:hypothetical protein